jgi:hypothetical protein
LKGWILAQKTKIEGVELKSLMNPAEKCDVGCKSKNVHYENTRLKKIVECPQTWPHTIDVEG